MGILVAVVLLFFLVFIFVFVFLYFIFSSVFDVDTFFDILYSACLMQVFMIYELSYIIYHI